MDEKCVAMKMKNLRETNRGPYGHVDLSEVLFEIQQIGNSVRVCAVDPNSNTEIVVVGAPWMSLYSLKINAIRKLRYVMAKKETERQAKR